MSSESYQSTTDRRRIRGILLALVIEGLVALMLLQLGGGGFLKQPQQPKLSTFDVSPVAPIGPKKAAKEKKVASKQQPVKPAGAAPAPTGAPVPPIKPAKPQYIQLSPDDYAATDIGKIPAHQGEGDGNNSGKDSVAAYGPGEGPGGSTLYNAEWYREPRDAELNFYLPKNIQSGSALIACKTIENYHVENCRSLGEDPPGSGLARAMREAAWQFLIRPPRINGKPMIGAWVRIRYDLTVGFKK